MVQPVIGLVSGTYNRLELLKAMIQSFRDNIPLGIIYTITIVDGGSTDGTLQWLETQKDIKVIADGKLTGAISAFTRGAQATDAKTVLLANDDVAFQRNSIIPAIVHLENNMRCGAVAFKDDRPVGSYTRKDYKTLQMEGNLNGKRIGVIYAQVGLFRKWLGDKLQWWQGEHDEMVGAWTYGGDNSLSAQIWNKGYTVDEVPECIVEDHVANDELREINYRKGLDSDDSKYFYRQWPQGVIVNEDPQVPQQDRRAARILYLPIYEPGWAVQKHPIHGKHGLRDALARSKNKYGATHIVQEFDYLSIDPKQLRSRLVEIAETFKPDLILSQIQSPAPLTADMLSELKARTGATLVNWNGDQAVGGLYSAQLLPILRQIDLQLITNVESAVVDNYEREGIKWAYWQIGYEESADDEHTQGTADGYFHELGRVSPFDTNPQWTVVYLASLRSPERQAIAKVVEEFRGRVFSPSDEFATLYNFSTSKAIYRRAKVIISDNGFTSRGFVSNRLFQALAAGGGVVLQQHVDGLDELTGLKSSTHYIEWFDLEDFRQVLNDVTNPEFREQVRYVAEHGTAFVRANFSFDAQVAKLMVLIREKLGESEQLQNTVALRYVGKNQFGFGLGNSYPSGQRYEHVAGRLLYAKREDVDTIMQWYPQQWEVFNG
jgi:glycosyltransferase involved in cell wall biosynthesis